MPDVNIKDNRGNSKSHKKKNVSENKINDNYNYNKKVVYTELMGFKKNTRNTSEKKDRNKKHRVKVINNVNNSTKLISIIIPSIVARINILIL